MAISDECLRHYLATGDQDYKPHLAEVCVELLAARAALAKVEAAPVGEVVTNYLGFKDAGVGTRIFMELSEPTSIYPDGQRVRLVPVGDDK